MTLTFPVNCVVIIAKSWENLAEFLGQVCKTGSNIRIQGKSSDLLCLVWFFKVGLHYERHGDVWSTCQLVVNVESCNKNVKIKMSNAGEMSAGVVG